MKRDAETETATTAEDASKKQKMDNEQKEEEPIPAQETAPPVIAKDEAEYLEKRLELLKKEKELTQMREEVAQLRRALPWNQVTKDYEFDGPDGKVPLKALFGDKTQLIVQHFMFNPEWKAGCKSCSFMADHMTKAVPHLNAKDVAYAAVGRAPLAKLVDFQKRMGWTEECATKFYSSHDSDFNFDMKVAFRKADFDENSSSLNYNFKDQAWFMEDFPGISVFALKDDQIYHTYSVFGRGLDPFITTYQFLDIVPKGRNEGGKENKYKMSWVKLRDEY